MHLNISEHFSGTIQGEGRYAGHLASFLRLAGCNLTCSWCDSAYTWDWDKYDHSQEVRQMSVEDVTGVVRRMKGRIVVTGGEPLLQSSGLGYVMSRFADTREFDLETNGTRPLGATKGMWSGITCSPKVIPSADQGKLARRIHPDMINSADFKFVIRDGADLEAVDSFIEEHGIASSRVWLMPEGITAQSITDRTPAVANAAVARGMNFSSRLHVYAWGDERGH